MMLERIQQKQARILEYVQLIKSIQDDCLQRFDADPLYRGALLHYLYLMADSCIALAELVIKHNNLRLPQTYSEAFDILGDNHILNPEFAHSFARIAGFRNFLAHDYERIDGQRICQSLISGMDDVERYVHEVNKTLKGI